MKNDGYMLFRRQKYANIQLLAFPGHPQITWQRRTYIGFVQDVPKRHPENIVRVAWKMTVMLLSVHIVTADIKQYNIFFLILPRGKDEQSVRVELSHNRMYTTIQLNLILFE